MERLAGASSLAVGGLADAAFAFGEVPVDDPPAVSIAQAAISEGGGPAQNHRLPSRPASPVVAPELDDHAARVDFAPAGLEDRSSSPAILGPALEAGVIRPLALAPSPLPITMRTPPAFFQPLAMSSAVGHGIEGAPSSAVIASAVQPAQITAASEPSASAGIFGSFAMSGYIATGGSTEPVRSAPAQFAASGGGSTSGMSSSSVSSPATNSSSSAGNTSGVSTSTSGDYSYQQPNGSGGMETIHGKLIISGSGGGYIGSHASFGVTAPGGGAITDETWSVSGTAYTNSTFNNVKGAMEWQHPAFTPPAASANAAGIGFNWGETPGTYKVTVSAKVGGVATTPAVWTVVVKDPQVTKKLGWLPHNQIINGKTIEYSSTDPGTGTKTAGIGWSFTSTNGSFGVEQLITSDSATSASATQMLHGWYDPAGVPMPTPALDATALATPPWYGDPANASTDYPMVTPATYVANSTYSGLPRGGIQP